MIHRAGKGYKGGFSMLLVTATLAIAAGLAAFFVGAVPDISNPTVMFLSVAILYAAQAIEHWLVKRYWAKVRKERMARFVTCERSVEIDEAGVSMTAPDAFWRFGWSAITDVTSAHGLVVYWIDIDRGLVVPRRAFADEDVKRLADLTASVRNRENPR